MKTDTNNRYDNTTKTLKPTSCMSSTNIKVALKWIIKNSQNLCKTDKEGIAILNYNTMSDLRFNAREIGIVKKNKDGIFRKSRDSLAVFTPIAPLLDERRYIYQKKNAGKMVDKEANATDILQSVAPYTMAGNKAALFSKRGFSGVVDDFLSGAHTVFDLFSGTSLFSNMLIKRYGFDGEVITNEYDKARYKTLIDIRDNHEELIERVESVLLYCRKVYSKYKDSDMSRAKELVSVVLSEGMLNGNSAHYIVAQLISLKSIAVNYDDIVGAYESPEIFKVIFGTSRGCRLDTDIEAIATRIRKAHALSKNLRILNQNSIDIMTTLLNEHDDLSGYSLYLDPDYVNFEASGIKGAKNMSYNQKTAFMKDVKEFGKKVIDKLLVPLRDRGAKILITNEYNETLIRHLRKRGFYVAYTTRGENKPEIVAASFEISQEHLDENDVLILSRQKKRKLNGSRLITSSIEYARFLVTMHGEQRVNNELPLSNISTMLKCTSSKESLRCIGEDSLSSDLQLDMYLKMHTGQLLPCIHNTKQKHGIGVLHDRYAIGSKAYAHYGMSTIHEPMDGLLRIIVKRLPVGVNNNLYPGCHLLLKTRRANFNGYGIDSS
jgi:hypothetical protein